LKAYVEYLNMLISLTEKIRETQGEKIDESADIIVDAIQNGKMVFFWGPGGHSSIFAEDVLYREGELACINPIIDSNIALSHGALKEINYFERIPEIAKAIIKSNQVTKGDVIVIGSAYGVNPVCIAGALYCKELGVKVIAVTSHAFSDALDNDDARHENKQGLYEIADVYINSFSPPDDLVLIREGFKQKFGSIGTIMQLLTSKALTTTVIEKLIEINGEAPVWRNALEKDGKEFNEKYMERMWHCAKSM